MTIRADWIRVFGACAITVWPVVLVVGVPDAATVKHEAVLSLVAIATPPLVKDIKRRVPAP
jgi:hypothetical protein